MDPEPKKYEGTKIELEPDSYEYWSEKLNCEKKDLMEAIFKVGNHLPVVISFLEMNGKIKEN
ncbi:MAG: DUF3606 domain-containing protein [Bacteroidota bacterium]|nr:DUF3606 domain-containing protein [Bacteroidota bacterium]